MKSVRRIPLSIPVLSAAEREHVLAALESGWVSSAGPDIKRFEEEIAALAGTRFAVATSSGTAAIHLALRIAGVAPGDAVVVPSLTFIGTVNPIGFCGAAPLLADVLPSDGTIDVAALERYLRDRVTRRDGVSRTPEGLRLRAVVPVHLYGAPARIEMLRSLCDEFGLALVEDAAEALGSRWGDRPLGSFGLAGCLSFNGNKIVTTGGGGMVVTDGPDVARRARYLSTQARDDPREYRHEEIGYNYRLTNLQAALGIGQLVGFAARLARKREIAARYRAGLAGAPLRFLEPEHPAAVTNHWLVAIVLDDATGRERLLADLDEAGIESRSFFVPVHRQRPYATAARIAEIRVADALYGAGLNLPSSPDLTDDDIEFVCAKVREALRRP